jgi:uncharacterized paraquat-inducible protein A
MDAKQRGSSCNSKGAAGCGCRGKDFGPMEDHEDPSLDDIERFSNATRVCSECKTEVYDDAEVCHNCGHVFNQRDDGRFVPTWAIATTVGLIAAFALSMIFYF